MIVSESGRDILPRRQGHRQPQVTAICDQVVIADYDPSWPATFQQLRDRLAASLGPLAVAIEQVGSTAAPRLAAKPIIDLDAVIADRVDLLAVIQRLRPSATTTKATSESRAVKPSPPRPAHHPITCTSAQSALPR